MLVETVIIIGRLGDQERRLYCWPGEYRKCQWHAGTFLSTLRGINYSVVGTSLYVYIKTVSFMLETDENGGREEV